MAGGRIRDNAALMHVEDLEQIVLRITLLCFIGNVEQRMDASKIFFVCWLDHVLHAGLRCGFSNQRLSHNYNAVLQRGHNY